MTISNETNVLTQKAINLLQKALEDNDLCIYTKGHKGLDDTDDDRYVDFCTTAAEGGFYEMIGVAGSGWKTVMFSDTLEPAFDDVEWAEGQALRDTWVPVPVFMKLFGDDIFTNVKQGGERLPANAGSFYEDLGVYWQLPGFTTLVLNKAKAEAILLQMSGEDVSVPKNVRQAAAQGLSSKHW